MGWGLTFRDLLHHETGGAEKVVQWSAVIDFCGTAPLAPLPELKGRWRTGAHPASRAAAAAGQKRHRARLRLTACRPCARLHHKICCIRSAIGVLWRHDKRYHCCTTFPPSTCRGGQVTSRPPLAARNHRNGVVRRTSCRCSKNRGND
jgi:hypothetical protein